MVERIQQLIWLGAGNSKDPCIDFNSYSKVFLVDAREDACKYLAQLHHGENIQVECHLLASSSEIMPFNYYNQREFSAINQATGLQALFPGLKIKQSEQRISLSITTFIESLTPQLTLSSPSNTLIIDIPDQAHIFIEQLIASRKIELFDTLYLQYGVTELYKGMVKFEMLSEIIQNQFFELYSVDGNDPDLPVYCFKFNQAAKDNAELKQCIIELRGKLTVAEKKLANESEQSKKIIADLKKQIEKLEIQYSKEISEIKQSQDILISQLDTANDVIEFEKKNNNALITEMSKIKNHHDSEVFEFRKIIKELENKAESTEDYLAEYKNLLSAESASKKLLQGSKDLLENIDRNLSRKIDDINNLKLVEINNLINSVKVDIFESSKNTNKQLEAFLSINNYLYNGIKPLDFHGWPISPDLGLHLIGLIDENSYDLIIEFGSGTSTVLIAKALLAKRARKASGQNTSKDKLVDSSSNTGLFWPDNEKVIVTFEHNSVYYEKTLRSLKDHQVESLVELVYSPLVTYQHSESDKYLYYNCAEKLAELAELYNLKGANVLVLVDGPPSSTNKMARFPALPFILDKLPSHSFTLVLDDSKRDDEINTIYSWKSVLKSRFITFEIVNVDTEKGLSIVKFQA